MTLKGYPGSTIESLEPKVLYSLRSMMTSLPIIQYIAEETRQAPNGLYREWWAANRHIKITSPSSLPSIDYPSDYSDGRVIGVTLRVAVPDVPYEMSSDMGAAPSSWSDLVYSGEDSEDPDVMLASWIDSISESVHQLFDLHVEATRHSPEKNVVCVEWEMFNPNAEIAMVWSSPEGRPDKTITHRTAYIRDIMPPYNSLLDELCNSDDDEYDSV